MDNNPGSLGSKTMTENVHGKRGNCYRSGKTGTLVCLNKRKADIISVNETLPTCVFLI